MIHISKIEEYLHQMSKIMSEEYIKQISINAYENDKKKSKNIEIPEYLNRQEIIKSWNEEKISDSLNNAEQNKGNSTLGTKILEQTAEKISEFFHNEKHKLKDLIVLETFSGNGIASYTILKFFEKYIKKWVMTDIVEYEKEKEEKDDIIKFEKLNSVDSVKKYGSESNVLLLISPEPGNNYADYFACKDFIEQTKPIEKKFIIFIGDLGFTDGSEGMYKYLNNNPNLKLVLQDVVFYYLDDFESAIPHKELFIFEIIDKTIEKNVFELLHTQKIHNNEIRSLSFSSDGNYIAFGSSENVTILKADDDYSTLNLKSNNNTLLSPDGKNIASSDKKKIIITSVDDNTVSEINTTTIVVKLSYSSNGKLAFTNGRDVKILNEEKVSLSNDGGVISMEFSSDGNLLASASMKGTLKIWKIIYDKEKKIEQTEQLKEIIIRSSKIIKDPAKIPVSSTGPKGKQIYYFEYSVTKNIERLYKILISFSSDSEYISISSFNFIRIYKIGEYITLVKQIDIVEKKISSLSIYNDNKDGLYIAYVTGNGNVKIKKNLNDNDDSIYDLNLKDCVKVLFSNDGKHLAVGSKDGTVRIFEKKNQKIRVEEEPCCCVMIDDGKRRSKRKKRSRRSKRKKRSRRKKSKRFSKRWM